MPVIAVAPEEKARSTNSTVSALDRLEAVLVGVGAKPVVEASTRPTAINVAMPSTNAYVGAEKSAPASRTPRRLPISRIAIAASPSATRGVAEAGDGRGDRRYSGGDRHSHGQDVVDQQAGGRDQRRKLAEVPVGDDVGPSAMGVGPDQLAVGEADREHQHDDRHRDARARAPARCCRRARARPASPRARTRPTRGRPRTGPQARPACASVRERPRCCSAVSPAPPDATSKRRARTARAQRWRAGSPPALPDRRSRRSRPPRTGFDAPPPLSVESGAGPDRPAVRATTLVARPAPAPSARPRGARRRAPPRPNPRPWTPDRRRSSPPRSCVPARRRGV